MTEQQTAAQDARIAELEAQLEAVGAGGVTLVRNTPTEQWIGVAERLPEWVHRDDTPCHINGKEVPPTLTSKTVLVALDGGGVRTDKLTTIEGKSAGWWHTYGERVIAWQDTPAPPQGAEAVRWEFRWLNPGNNPYSPPSEMAWKLVEPKGMQPLDATLSDLRAYRYAGKPCYEVRPLFAQAAPVAPAPPQGAAKGDE